MSANPRARNGNARRKVVRWLSRQGRSCHICGLPIDYAIADPHDPRHFECDEQLPVSLGGSPYDRANVAAAHRFCNEWRGNRMGWSPAAARSAFLAASSAFLARSSPPRPTPHSRDW